jgi:predicted Rdx family selenoprotein
MSRVFTSKDKPEQIIKHVAVVIKRTAPGLYHSALAYKLDGEWQMLELGWFCLANGLMDIANADYIWINPEPAIHETRLALLATRCNQIWERKIDGGYPYGFSNPKNWINPDTGTAQRMPEGMGLTCASFVLAAFWSIATPLLNESTWILRPDEDKEYWERIIGYMKQSPKVTEQHLKGVIESLPAIRYRPEEVAGAAACDPIPADFHPSNAKGQQILKLLGDN